MPEIVYLQTITACNGHCRYCPFDDVYQGKPVQEMSFNIFKTVLEWLKSQNYKSRIGFLLHYEPTMDPNLEWRVDYARNVLPGVSLEVATNGIIDSPILKRFDRVDCVPAGSRTVATSRAGNCQPTPETISGVRLIEPPCIVPAATMPIAANGDALLCCQDWRHEAVVGTWKDLDAARGYQLSLVGRVQNQELEICQDCMAGKTAEEVGNRLGKRFIS